MDKLLRLPKVMECTGLSRATIYRLMALGHFPQRVQLAARTIAWRESEVAAWCAARPKVRSPPTPAGGRVPNK
jgi:prophage regulatory protein